MRDTIALKHTLMELAQFIRPGESMTAQDSAMSLRALVAWIASNAGVTNLQVALIALTLAEYIEAQ